MTATTLNPPASGSRTEAFRWLVGAAVVSVPIVAVGGGNLSEAFASFPVQVVAVYVALELFTSMIRGTGLLDVLSVRAAGYARSDRRRVLVVFSLLLMGIGTVNNNLTALVVVFPVLVAVLKALQPSPAYLRLMCSLVLAVGNCAGAATPVGDFPALLIMSTGIVSFGTYLLLAFPLFCATAAALVFVYRRMATRIDVGEGDWSEADADVSLRLLTERHRHRRIERRAVVKLALVFVAMVVLWITVPFETLPPALVAWAGLALAAVLVERDGVEPQFHSFDLDGVVRIMAVFFVAALIGTTPLVPGIADRLAGATDDPLLLILGVMVFTALVCAVIDAGGAAAALLPMVQTLTAPGQPLHEVTAVTVIAFAAAICAGSSMLLTSATAGQLLSSKVGAAGFTDGGGGTARFGFGSYLRFGLLNFGLQLGVAVVWVVSALVLRGAL